MSLDGAWVTYMGHWPFILPPQHGDLQTPSVSTSTQIIRLQFMDLSVPIHAHYRYPDNAVTASACLCPPIPNRCALPHHPP